jgi:hypothetical protein
MKKIIISSVVILVVLILGIFIFKKLQPELMVIEEIPLEEILSAGNLGTQYVNSRVGFTIYPPEDWAIDESGQLGTFAVFVPSDPGPTDAVTSITVIAEPANHLEDYVRETRKRLPEILNNFEQVENRRVALGEIEGHFIGGRFTFDEVSVRTLRLIVSVDGRGYNITATALESAWNSWEKTFTESLLTFRP